MSTIGSGPGLGSGGTIEVSTALKVTPTDTQPATVDANTTAAQATTVNTGSQATTSNGVVTTTATSVGAIPQDGDRVAAIKKAIESGQYPILPTKISDAMIAASMLWRSPK